MKTMNSMFGAETKEIYVNGRYCGLCHVDALPVLKELERSVRGSKKLARTARTVLSQGGSRPLGGFALESSLNNWLEKFGQFSGHLWADKGRGILWSPVAWSLVMVLTRSI